MTQSSSPDSRAELAAIRRQPPASAMALRRGVWDDAMDHGGAMGRLAQDQAVLDASHAIVGPSLPIVERERFSLALQEFETAQAVA